jgi:DNA polymerase III subunit delta'
MNPNEIFKDVYGQETVKNSLITLMNSARVPHAFLFTGKEGVGKDFLSLRFAEIINTAGLDKEKAALASNQIRKMSEPFVKYIIPLPRGKNELDDSGPLEKLTPDEIEAIKFELSQKIKNPYHKIRIPKGNIIKIGSIRDLKKFTAFEYSEVKYRVIIISDAHLMGDPSQNALLKNLEEPPPGIIFILTTPYPDLLRETIRSRCWGISFLPLAVEDVKNILVDKFEIPAAEAETASIFSEGSVTEALTLIEHDINLLLEKTIFILRYSLGKKYHSALEEFKDFLRTGDTAAIKIIIRLIIIWLNDSRKLTYGNSDIYFSNHIETLEKFISKFPESQINSTAVQLEKLADSLKNNININTLVLNLIFELSKLTDRLK